MKQSSSSHWPVVAAVWIWTSGDGRERGVGAENLAALRRSSHRPQDAFAYERHCPTQPLACAAAWRPKQSRCLPPLEQSHCRPHSQSRRARHGGWRGARSRRDSPGAGEGPEASGRGPLDALGHGGPLGLGACELGFMQPTEPHRRGHGGRRSGSRMRPPAALVKAGAGLVVGPELATKGRHYGRKSDATGEEEGGN